jgi:hypothetical protein
MARKLFTIIIMQHYGYFPISELEERLATIKSILSADQPEPQTRLQTSKAPQSRSSIDLLWYHYWIDGAEAETWGRSIADLISNVPWKKGIRHVEIRIQEGKTDFPPRRSY